MPLKPRLLLALLPALACALLVSACTASQAGHPGSHTSGSAPEASLHLAAQQAQTRLTRARNAAERATLPDPTALRSMHNAMSEAADAGRWQEALALADLLVHLEADFWPAHVVRTRALYWGFLEEDAALEAASVCLALQPPPIECQEVHAMVHFDRGQLHEALEALEVLLDMQPMHRRGHELTARARMQLGLHEEAVHGLRWMIELWPSDIQVRLLFASALERVGNLRAAEIAWQHVAYHHRSPTQGLRYLQAFHERVGNREAARRLERELSDLTSAPTRRRLDPL